MKIKRRHYFINKRMQGKFIFRFVAASLFGGLVAIAFFIMLANRRIDSVLYAMSLPKTTTGNLLVNEMLYATLIAIGAVLIALIFATRGLFNRINGPLTKMAVDLKNIGRGDLRINVSLRRQDDFHEFAGNVNRMTAELRKRFVLIGRNIRDIRVIAVRDQEILAAETRKVCADKIAEIEAVLDSFKV
jgi:methyl-accepting chemotaxis protein